VEVTPVNYDDLVNGMPKESSADIRKRVVEAREVQGRRFSDPLIERSRDQGLGISATLDTQVEIHTQVEIGTYVGIDPKNNDGSRAQSRQRIHSNSEMSSKQIREHCKLDSKSAELLKKATNNLGFSARAYDRILKVARTIADLENAIDIGADHIAEAIQYRSLDRENWAGLYFIKKIVSKASDD
jgi:predicted ATPase with chaperone activity